MKKQLFTALMACVMAGNLHAQFHNSYGLPSNESLPSVQNTSDNGYIAAGKTDQVVFGSGDATLVKTDVNGIQLWSTVYGGAASDQFASVKETPNAAVRYVAAGSSYSYSGTEDGFLVGTNLNGVALFTKTFGGPKIDRFNHIQKIVHPVDGPGYIIVGESNSYNFYDTGYDIFVVRIDLNGNLKASAIIGNKGDQKGNWIEPTGDGYIIAGSTTINCTVSTTGIVQTDIYAVKIDHNLNIVWDRVFGNNANLRDDVASGVKVDNVGNYVFTGETQSYGLPGGDAFLLKTTPLGGTVFFKTYGGGRNDQGKSLIVEKTAAGVFYVVTGNSSAYNSLATPDAYLFKTDVNGNHIWSRVFGKEKPDFANEINFSSPLTNGYVISGNQFSFGAGNSDGYLLKTDLNGNTGNPCERYVTPTVQSFWPCLFSGVQVVKIENIKTVPNNFKYISYAVTKCFVPIVLPARVDETDNLNIESGIVVSPNPASSYITVKGVYELKGSAVSIKDLNGKTVKEVTIESEEQSVSVEDLEKGMYLIVITEPDGTVKKEKLVIQ